MADHEAWIARARNWGVKSRMPSQAGIAERFPDWRFQRLRAPLRAAA